MTLHVKLPTIQNWSCHNCSGCCRQHAIEVTEEERARITAQNWTEQDGIVPGKLFIPLGGPPWKRRYRLAHQQDGACVFLNSEGLCSIHAKFGEDAKPFACRLYPYVFHPAGDGVTVSLRFSCPSVVANRGVPVSENRVEIKKLARVVVPAGGEAMPPPAISPRQRVDWPDFRRFVKWLDSTFAEPDVPFALKLQRALFWVGLVGESRFDMIRGERLEEFLSLIIDAAMAEVEHEALAEPGSMARMQFRLLVAQYARTDTFAHVDAGWRGRMWLFNSAIRFARGQGTIPVLQDAFQDVPFAAIEPPFGGLPAEAEEILTRYMRVKIQGIHFCGPAYYNVPFVEGFQSLSLIIAAIFWLARWHAAGEGRQTLETQDIATAVSIADHHHGYSPVFGRVTFRQRVRTLAQTNDIRKLCAWYAR